MRPALFKRRGAGLAPPTDFAATVVTLPPPAPPPARAEAGRAGGSAGAGGFPPAPTAGEIAGAAPPSLAFDTQPPALPAHSAGGEVADAALHGQPTLWQVGRYAVKGPLGSGGLGQVWEAWDPLLSRAVALKTLPLAGADETARQTGEAMFLREARAAAGLSHPHIVTVHDAGLTAQGLYLAMERLHGRDLRRALASGWRPTPWQAAQLARRIADALSYAHARGVVHCDVKPSNIFLDARDRPKLLDFGIARLSQPGAAVPAAPAQASPHDQGGWVIGSPHYLAPEQLREGSADARTDIHGLGLVLYELLTGRRAFEGHSVAEITAAVLDGRVPPAHRLRPGVPPALSAIAERAMAPLASARYASAGEMAGELRRWNDSHRQAQAAAAGSGPGGRGAGASPAARPSPQPPDAVVATPPAGPSRRVTSATIPTTVPCTAEDDGVPDPLQDTAPLPRPGGGRRGSTRAAPARRPAARRWPWAATLLLSAVAVAGGGLLLSR